MERRGFNSRGLISKVPWYEVKRLSQKLFFESFILLPPGCTDARSDHNNSAQAETGRIS